MLRPGGVLGGVVLITLLWGCSPEPQPEPEFVFGGEGLRPGRMRYPRALALDAKRGFLFVADKTCRIQRFELDGAFALEWRLPACERGYPVGLACDPAGDLLVSHAHYQKIIRYGSAGTLLHSWGGPGEGPGEFTLARDVAVDAQGCVYAGDYGAYNDRIQKFAPDGAFLLEWGGHGSEPGHFDRPQGLAIERLDGREYLLVADTSNHRIQRFDLEGRFQGMWGSLGEGPGELRYPSGIAVAPDGSILVCEWGNNRIQRFDPEGHSLGIWGRPGRDPGELAMPWDVAVAPDGTVFVADYGNHRIQAFRWPGIAGTPGSGGGRP